MGILGFGSSTTEKSKVSKFTWIPERDDDVDDIGKEVSDNWQLLRDEFSIKDKSPDKMQENCTLYHSDRVSINEIELGGGTRKERWTALEEKVDRGKCQAEMGKAIDQMIVGIKFHGMQKAPIGLKFWE